VEVVTVPDFHTLRVKVYERGVGVTPACGSGACASAAAAYKYGLTDKKVTVHLDGGTLTIETLSDGHILMTGTIQLSFEGTFAKSLLE